MSITRLQQARQMYALGKLVERVSFRGGGRDMGSTGSSTGSSGPAGGASSGGTYGGNTGGGNTGGGNTGGNSNDGPSYSPHTDTGFTGPSSYGPPSPVDRSAVGQFSTYGRNLMNQNLRGPKIVSQLGTTIKDYIMGGGLIGAGIRGLSSLFNPTKNLDFYNEKVVPAGRTNLDYDNYMKQRMAGYIDAYGNSIDNQSNNDDGGIMDLYIQNNTEENEEIPINNFKQRYRVDNELRQDKEGQLDPQIMAMINKLYTTPTV